ncbi:hypothetical protein M747DRAFT_155474 [Aspergillus niger ATCC 13496]|uniref:Uncharacterized protein n=1 Tax=Aspergillus niger ATCC 13496 TaxID=1353008 RepID=A0A370CCG4_ASPNG|nr:hypothetical protein M747DRAFT_155474 [Aspergillus niger ATCC 13496]
MSWTGGDTTRQMFLMHPGCTCSINLSGGRCVGWLSLVLHAASVCEWQGGFGCTLLCLVPLFRA